MRILDVCPRMVVPPLRGAAARAYQLARFLSEHHEVRQFSQASLGLGRSRELPVTPTYRVVRYANPIAAAIADVGERTWVGAPVLSGVGLRLTDPASLRRLVAWSEVALVQFPWQFEHCRRLGGGTPLVLAGHNVEAQKFASWADAAGRPASAGPWLRAIERAEADAVARADLVLAVSESDRVALVERYGADPDRVVEIPNGADTARIVPAESDRRARAKRELGLPDRPLVLFVGANIPPNEVGLRWVKRVAARMPAVTFAVVGSVARRRSKGNLVAAGVVPDVVPYLAAADVSLCPIQHGGGTKIKLLESLAAGVPTVAFAESLEGTAAVPGEHVLLAGRDVGELAGAIERLLADEGLRERIGRSARALAVERHDWRTIGARLDAELVRLVEGRR